METNKRYDLEIQLNEEDMQAILDCRKLTIREPVKGLKVSRTFDGLITDEANIEEIHGRFLHDGVLLEQPFKTGDIVNFKSDTITVLAQVIEVSVERLQDIDGLKVYNEGIEVEVPPICKGITFPVEMESWSESAKDDWFKKTARARYIANIELNNRLVDAFMRKWNKKLSTEDYDSYCWRTNPYVYVAEFRMLKDLCNCCGTNGFKMCATI